MSDTILEVRHLSKAFGAHVVLKDIDFTVSPGDVTRPAPASPPFCGASTCWRLPPPVRSGSTIRTSPERV